MGPSWPWLLSLDSSSSAAIAVGRRKSLRNTGWGTTAEHGRVSSIQTAANLYSSVFGRTPEGGEFTDKDPEGKGDGPDEHVSYEEERRVKSADRRDPQDDRSERSYDRRSDYTDRRDDPSDRRERYDRDDRYDDRRDRYDDRRDRHSDRNDRYDDRRDRYDDRRDRDDDSDHYSERYDSRDRPPSVPPNKPNKPNKPKDPRY